MSKMFSRIQKLMRLAADPAATPEEAATAAAMAAELSIRYNIDLADVTNDEHAEKHFEQGTANPKLKVYGRDRKAFTFLTSAISKLYGCQDFVRTRKDKSFAQFVFIGQKHNIEMAETWTDYLWQSCLRANRQFNKTDERRKHMNAAEKYKADGNFRYHFAWIVYGRLKAKFEELNQQGAKDSEGTSTALAVSTWYEQERKELTAWIAQHMNLRKARATRSMKIDVLAANAGREAGQRVSLDAQITAKSRPVAQITAN